MARVYVYLLLRLPIISRMHGMRKYTHTHTHTHAPTHTRDARACA